MKVTQEEILKPITLIYKYDFLFISASPDALVKCDCCPERVLEVNARIA